MGKKEAKEKKNEEWKQNERSEKREQDEWGGKERQERHQTDNKVEDEEE